MLSLSKKDNSLCIKNWAIHGVLYKGFKYLWLISTDRYGVVVGVNLQAMFDKSLAFWE